MITKKTKGKVSKKKSEPTKPLTIDDAVNSAEAQALLCEIAVGVARKFIALVGAEMAKLPGGMPTDARLVEAMVYESTRHILTGLVGASLDFGRPPAEVMSALRSIVRPSAEMLRVSADVKDTAVN